MGRQKRIQLAGGCYYIVLQGNNRQDLFHGGQDRRKFLEFLRQYKDRYRLQVYAYCLTDSEVHLLLETPEANLSLVMQGFNTSYTKYFNAQHGRVGHVFAGRYRSLLVDKDRHLATMTRFIHLYPGRAGVKESPWRYQWSSCAAYVESELKETLVDSAPVLGQLAKTRLKQSVMYLTYLKDRMRSLSELVIPVTRGLAVGGEEFLQGVLSGGEKPRPAQRDLMETARRILAEVAAKHGVDEDRLLSKVQWRDVSAARHKAIHRVWKETRLGVTEVGRLFNRTPSSVSQIIKTFEEAGNR